MTAHDSTKLSDAMRQALNRLAGGARLKRVSGSSWSTMPADDGQRLAWHCSSRTVAALERRGLIRAVVQDDRPWSEREFVLVTESVTDEGKAMKPSTLANASLHEEIQKEAYFIAMQRQDGDAYGHWLEAERRVLGRMTGKGA